MPSGLTRDSSALSLLSPFWVISEDTSLGSRTLGLITFSYTNGTQEALSICPLGRRQTWDPLPSGKGRALQSLAERGLLCQSELTAPVGWVLLVLLE